MKKESIVLYTLALLRLLLPFVMQHHSYQPHRDEFLYLDYANHMAWGYMEVPPLLSLFSWLGQGAGASLFWIKFWPAVFGSLTFLLCGKIALQAGGKLSSLVLLFACFVFGAFLRVFFLFQPGFLEIFCWTLISFCLVQYVRTTKTIWVLAFGVAGGLALLSKYTSFFFLAGWILAWCITGRAKSLVSRPFLMSFGIMAIMFLPNALWQYWHRFPVLYHMAELRETQLQHIRPSAFAADQLLMFLPVAAVWIAGMEALASRPVFRQFRWLAWQYTFVCLLLMLGSGKGYYALGLYPILFAFGVVVAIQWLQRQATAVRLALIGIPLALGLFTLPLGLPLFAPAQLAAFYARTGMSKMPFFKWEDRDMHALPQDFADMIGWREIADMTAKQYHALPDIVQQNTLLYCRGYYTAGALNLYGKSLGLPQAYSDNGSYLLWMPDSLKFQHLMMIGHQNPGPDDEVFNHFAERKILDSLQYPLFRENGIRVYFFEHADSNAARLATEGIRQKKLQFNR